MTSRDFCYWLQGYLEIRENKTSGINPAQTEMIQRHLNMVFKHEIDPSFGPDQIDLSKIHSGGFIHNPQDTPLMC